MEAKQTVLNQYFRQNRQQGSSSEEGSADESVFVPSKAKRLYDQPMSWTRIKSIELAVSQRVTVFDVEKDLASDKTLKRIRKDANR